MPRNGPDLDSKQMSLETLERVWQQRGFQPGSAHIRGLTLDEMDAICVVLEDLRYTRACIEAVLVLHGQEDDGLCAECGATWVDGEGCQSPTVKALLRQSGVPPGTDVSPAAATPEDIEIRQRTVRGEKPMTDLKRIEEKHERVPGFVKGTFTPAGMTCKKCGGLDDPCDVVKLARALDAIRTGAADPHAAATAERVLHEVAGGEK